MDKTKVSEKISKTINKLHGIDKQNPLVEGIDYTIDPEGKNVEPLSREFIEAMRQQSKEKLAKTKGIQNMVGNPIMSSVLKPNTKKSKTQKSKSAPKTENKVQPKSEPKQLDNTTQPIQNVESGDSEVTILNKMFSFMKDEYEWKNEKHKQDTSNKKKQKEDFNRRTDELIGLFTGKKQKPGKKVKTEKKKKEEEKKKPTVEKVPTKEPAKPSTAVKVATTAGAAVTGAAVVGGALTLGNLIAQKGESGKAGYNAANMGTRNNKIIAAKKQENLQDMTVGEIMSRQSIKWGASNEDQKLFAVGKYQMIPDTLADAVKSLNISKDEKFTPQLQERMFNEYLISKKRPAIAKYLNSPVDDPTLLTNAVRAISREWASVADPDKGGQTSFYGSGNKAHISVEEISSVLKRDREENLKKLNVPQQSLVPTLEKPPIPEKLKGSKEPSKTTVLSNNNTNVYNGGTTYNIKQEQENNNAPLFDKQYG